VRAAHARHLVTGIGQIQVGVAILGQELPVGDDVQQRVRGHRQALDERIKRRRTDRPGHRSEDVTGDRPQHFADAGCRGRGVKGPQAIAVESLGRGHQQQQAQVAPADRRKAAIGQARQIEREGQTLVEREEVPATVLGHAEPLPMPRLELVGLDRQEQAEAVIPARPRREEGVAYVSLQEEASEQGAVALRVDAGGDALPFKLGGLLGAEGKEALVTDGQECTGPALLQHDRPATLRLPLDRDLQQVHRFTVRSRCATPTDATSSGGANTERGRC
jgi:hypothetical protein